MIRTIRNFVTTKKMVTWVILALIGLGAWVLVNHNQQFYQQTIFQVQSVTNGDQVKQTDQFQNVDHLTSQKLTGVVVNGRYQGRHLSIKNSYSDSMAMDQKFKVGDQIFVTIVSRQSKLAGTIQGFKRDRVLVMLAWLTLTLLIVVMQFKGALALVSVAMNAVIFVFAINLNIQWQGAHVLLVFGLLALLFSVLTLLLVLGPSRQMLATLGATVLGTALSLLISLGVFAITHEKGMYYESMQYVTQVPRPLFLAETLLGSLGAVMDESTDIVATLFELKSIDPDVTASKLFWAGRTVGQSIMGPLINVLFLIFMADTFTSALLYIKNGNSWGYTFSMNMSMGTVQSLISGIGIVLAIPIASGLAGLLLGRRRSA